MDETTQGRMEKIVKSLDAIGHIDKKHYKYHKDYFFKGPSSINEALLSPNVFAGGKGVFEMWYHPEISLEAYKEIFNAHPNERDQEALFKFNRGCNIRLKDYEYGMMGGREELIVKAMFPSCDYEDVIEFKKNENISWFTHLAPNPSSCLINTTSGILPILLYPNKNRFSPGQYLIDHLDYCIDKLDKPKSDSSLYRMLHVLKKPNSHEKFQKDSAHVVEIANNLKQRFENEEFGETLMSYWNNIDELYEK